MATGSPYLPIVATLADLLGIQTYSSVHVKSTAAWAEEKQTGTCFI